MPASLPSTWSGGYIGGNGGYGWDNQSITSTADAAFFGAAITADNVPASFSPRTKGGLGGVQAGYNYQMGSGLIGLEADFDFASIRGSSSFLDPTGISFSASGERKISSLGTLRARAGWLPWSSLLLYVTGGLAYGKTELTVASSALPFAGGCAAAPGCLSSTSSGMRAGWTIGLGGEWMFAPAWSLKAEYLYVDLGSRSATLVSPLGPAGNFYTATTRFQENIVRGGINYHF